jgi:hypothetical protein
MISNSSRTSEITPERRTTGEGVAAREDSFVPLEASTAAEFITQIRNQQKIQALKKKQSPCAASKLEKTCEYTKSEE